MQFDYEKERPFYCEKMQRNCPFESRFRYCWDCEDPQEQADNYDKNED